jgi:hypothetical protein
MSQYDLTSTLRPEPDEILQQIASITWIGRSVRSATVFRCFSTTVRRPSLSLLSTRSATGGGVKEGVPALLRKFERNLRGRIPTRKADATLTLCSDRWRLEATPVDSLMDLFVV